jgi:hypothetical protein
MSQKLNKLEPNSIDIEQAIETVRQFTLTNEPGNTLSLAQFDLQDGSLHLQNRSTLEQTIAFIACTFSTSNRKKQSEKHKELTHTLQNSLNLLKIYSSALEQMNHNQGLAEKLLEAAQSYNAMVRQTKNKAPSISQKIKRFFLDIAGWSLDDELIQAEIHIPEPVEYSSHNLSSHKITIQKANDLSYLVPPLHTGLNPKKEELDAFKLKAITLLQTQKELTGLTHEEIVDLVQKQEIDSSFSPNTSLMSLRQKLSNFPGEEIEIKGSFQRDLLHPELCFPVKDSFKIHTRILQSGFPHPMQYIGFSLHEKLFPTLILQPKALPLLSALLEKKRSLSHALLPDGHLYSRAKKLFKHRCTLLPSYKKELEEVMQTLISASNHEACMTDFSFEVHEQIALRIIAKPLELVQKQWLFSNNTKIDCKKILHDAISEECQTLKQNSYALCLAQSLGSAIPNLYLLQLSEHFGFQAPTLSLFEKMLLTSLFRQELIFIAELEDTFEIDRFETHLESLFKEEKALFSNLPLSDEYTLHAQKLVNELVGYYLKTTVAC